MTDPITPQPSQPDVQPPPPVVPPPPMAPPPVESPEVAPPAKKSGGRGAIIIIGVIVAFLAIVLYAVKDNLSAGDLKVGDCFNTPSGSTVQTVEHHPCTESHTAEVIHVVEYTGDTSSYPISLTFSSFAEAACKPVFQTYTGRDFDLETELTIGYFYPSRDGWSGGDRTVTCYVTRVDDNPMTKSVKSS